MAKRRIIIKIIVWSLAIDLLLALATYLIWRQGSIQPWLQAKVVEFYVQQIEPGLPFKIEKAEVDAKWADFRKGKLTRLSLILKWDQWRIRMSGPIQITSEDNSFSVEYATQSTLEPARTPLKPGDQSTSFHLNLGTRVSENLKDIAELAVYFQADRFKWPMMGLEAEKILLNGGWLEKEAQVEFSAAQLGWTSPTASDQALNLTAVSFRASSPLAFKPLVVGPELRFDFRAKSSEIMHGESYLDLPLRSLPVRGVVKLKDKSIQAVQLDIGHRSELELEIENSKPARVSWKTKALSVGALVEETLKATQSGGGALTKLTALHDFKFLSGNLIIHGNALLSSEPRIDAKLQLKRVNLDLPGPKIALRNLNLSLPFSTETGSNGTIEIEKVLFRKAHARLASTPFSLKPTDKDRYSLSIGTNELPFTIEEIPVRIAPITGTLGPDDKHSFTTRVSMERRELAPIIDALCVGGGKIPPATLQFDFPQVKISEDTIDPTGSARVELFDGTIDVSEIAVFDYKTRVPETNFNIDVNGIKLEKVGQWLNFGEMDGTIEAYAHDVVLQALLPTQFDFRIEARPLNSKKVVFSGQAMKNLIRVLAAESYDSIPHIAKIFAFMGSYNLDFAGISAFSHDGAILLETLTPKEIYEKERNYYIFYGWRAKMPLHSSRHPVVVDAPAMGNFVRYMSQRLKDIEEEDARKSGKVKERENEITDPLCDPTRSGNSLRNG